MELAEAIENPGYVYMLDIHSNLTIYLEDSEIMVPSSTGKRGRKPFREKPLAQGVRADKYMSELRDEDWQYLEVRNTTKGKLRGNYHFRRVYIFDEENRGLFSNFIDKSLRMI
jgi:SRSO17 transposase